MLVSTHWACPPHDLFRNLSPGTVHVWRASLDDSPMQAARYYPDLSTDERAKAERYRVPRPQYQFVITRGILRRLLSHYAGVPAANLRIECNPHGKPALAPDASIMPLQFNVSHASGMALLAVTAEHAVGIDVERLDRAVSALDIAVRYFTPRESAQIASLPPDHRMPEFLTYWTCKEAYFKMRGTGLSDGLAQCEIALYPDNIRADVLLTDERIREDGCSLFRMNVGIMHIGALAVECPSVTVSFWEWKD